MNLSPLFVFGLFNKFGMTKLSQMLVQMKKKSGWVTHKEKSNPPSVQGAHTTKVK